MNAITTKYLTIVMAIGTVVLGFDGNADELDPKLQLYGKSILVYPILMGKEGAPDTDETRKFGVKVGEMVAVLFEQYGMQPELSAEHPESIADHDSLAVMEGKFQTFLEGKKAGTDYRLFARFRVGRSKHGPIITRICAVLVDAGGQTVWSEEQTEFPEEFHPLAACVGLVNTVQSISDLKEPDEASRKPGSFARRMQKQAGLPAPEEYEAMKERFKMARGAFKEASLTIYPFRIWKQKEGSRKGAEILARKLNEASVFNSTIVAEDDTHLVAKRDPDHPGQPNIIAASARDFQRYLKEHPPATDYALLVDVSVPVHHVHFVLCDKTGGWLHLNISNSHHPDFRRIKPGTVEDCAELVFGRMKEWKTSESSTPKVGFESWIGARDSNDDGMISREEFFAGAKKQRAKKGKSYDPETAARYFDRLDQNKDGFISPKEEPIHSK
jgi:hypothetical protein